MTYKTCTKCGEEFEATTKFFHKHKGGKFGLFSFCKSCRSKTSKEYNKTERGLAASRKAVIKYNNSEYGKMMHRKWQQSKKGKDCLKRWQQSDRGKESLKKASSKWHEKNPEYNKDYIKKNRGETNNKTAKYRASKLQATPAWANMDAIKLYYIWCNIFNIMFKPYMEFEVDHIVPLQGKNVCGLHVESNLQILPKHENKRKGAKYEY